MMREATWTGVLAGLMVAGVASADTIRYRQSGDWTQTAPLNDQPGWQNVATVPGEDDLGRINWGNNTVTLTTTETIGALQIGVDEQGNLLVVDGGTLSTVTGSGQNGRLTLGQGNNPAGTGTLTVESGGTVNVADILFHGVGADGTSHIYGAVQVGSHLWTGWGAGFTGTINIYDGGVLTVSGMLGLNWQNNGAVGYINVQDGGTLVLNQLHGDGSSSIRGDSRVNITGTGQIVRAGAHSNLFATYVAQDLIVANGVAEDVIITETNGETLVTAAEVIPDPPLFLTRFDPAGGTLAFEWSDIPGRQFDLVSAEDLTIPAERWEPYNDGVTTYEDIPNSGTGANALTGVLPVDGPSRFFAVRKEFGAGLALFMEDFDAVAGLPEGWTRGANAGDSGSTQWEVGIPSSVGPAEAHSLSNCVATGISADYGANVDIWLRTPEIDLSGVTDATLRFKQSRELEAIKDRGSVRVLKADDGTPLGEALPVSVAGSDFGAWVNAEVDLPPEALGEMIQIEFQFQADADNEALWNASFEFPVLLDADDVDAVGPTWVRGRYDGSGTNWFDQTDLTAKIWNPDSIDGFGSVPDGVNVGVVTAKYDFDTAMKQSLPITLEANTQYDLSFFVGSPYDNGDGTLGKPIPDYRVELVAGIGVDGVVIASDTGASPASFVNQWAFHSLSYNSGANPERLGEPLEIRLVAVARGTSVSDPDGVHGQRLAFDNLVLSITPDPGDLGLAGWYIDDVEVTGPIP